MSKNLIKLIVSSALLVAFIALSVLFTLKNVTITDSIKFLSIQGLVDRKDDVLKKEQQLLAEQAKYTETLGKLTEAQNEFDREKAKYESISDETIEIIKEATTEDNYNMEYMWIKLGNYAKINNLSLIVIEPGNDPEVLVVGNQAAPEDTSNELVTSETQTGTEVTSSSAQTDFEGKNIFEDGNKQPEMLENDSDDDRTMKIQLQGSYIDISDFIFEVENDNELKFKLDNIYIEYVEGTTIKATFDVKNTIIVK